MTGPRCLLLDIDGVLTVSWKPLPGAADAVRRLRESGRNVAFLTNTTTTPRQRILERLAEAGIAAALEEIFTAPRATASYLSDTRPGARCLLINSGSIETDLEGVELVPADSPHIDVVLTGGAGSETGYDILNRAFRALLDGAELVSMHRNLQWQTASGLQLDMGAFIVGLEQATGKEAAVVGKPAPEFYNAVLHDLGLAADQTVMVGDDLEADVEGAQGVGITAVLVRTGKFRNESLERSHVRPDHIIDSVADLPALLGSS